MSTGNQSILSSFQQFGFCAPTGDLPDVARAGAPPHEELLVRYTIGIGKFSRDKKYLSIQGKVFLLNEEPYGEWEGACEFVVPLSKLGKTPPPAAPPPFNRPAGPLPQPAPQAFAKGRWRFADGSSLTAFGQAQLHTTELSTLATIFWISSNQIITEGSGQFQGAQGLKTAGLSILLPPGKLVEDVEEAPVKTIDVFRVLRKDFIGKLPPLPRAG